jgi:hypothetical protein
LEEFNKQKAELNRKGEWIQKTVSSQGYEFCCIPSEYLESYGNLKKNVEIDESRVMELAQEAYQKAIESPKTKDIYPCISNWKFAKGSFGPTFGAHSRR